MPDDAFPDGRKHPDIGFEPNRRAKAVEDKDVARLDEKIAFSQEIAQARLDAAMAKIDGKLEMIVAALQDRSSKTDELSSRVEHFHGDLALRIDRVQGETAARFDRVQSETAVRFDRNQLETAARFERMQGETAARFDRNQLEMAARFDRAQDATRIWGQWIIGTILIVALAGFGLMIGLKQVWIGGVQVGQVLQPAPQHPGSAAGQAP